MRLERATEAQIEAAAKWWKERLRSPKFQTLSAKERRDPGSRGAAVAELLASTFRQALSEEQLNRFEEELKVGLRDMRNVYCVGVDYGPDGVLGDAATRAGIDFSRREVFPWKTRMFFEPDGSLQASCGYGAPSETVLEASQ